VFGVGYKKTFKVYCIQFYNITFWYIKVHKPTIKQPILWAKNVIPRSEATMSIRSVPEGDSEKQIDLG